MSGRTPSERAKQHICVRCMGGVADDRPLYLIAHPSGRIVGPFHAGCAERMILAAKKHETSQREVLAESFGTWPSIREETLPQ